jgi:hypothetical protein
MQGSLDPIAVGAEVQVLLKAELKGALLRCWALEEDVQLLWELLRRQWQLFGAQQSRWHTSAYM